MAATCALPSLVSCSSLIGSKCSQRAAPSSREAVCCLKPFNPQNAHNSATERFSSRCVDSRTEFAALQHAKPRLLFQSYQKAGVKRHRGVVRASAESENETQPEKTPFGYTRKDVIILGAGVIVAGFALKYGLEAAGVDSLVAGNVIQITFVLGLTVLWIFSYVFRVANKEMTYVKQLKNYEEEVMKKRLEELPEAELENMLASVEEEKRRLEERRKAKQ